MAGAGDASGRLEESFCSTDPRILRTFARATFLSDHRDILPKVDVPCLVVQCERDDLAPRSVGEFVAAQLPRAELQLLDAPGHMPQVSHTDEVEALIRSYLAREV